MWWFQEEPRPEGLSSHRSLCAHAEHVVVVGPGALLVHAGSRKTPLAIVAWVAAEALLGQVLLLVQQARTAEGLW